MIFSYEYATLYEAFSIRPSVRPGDWVENCGNAHFRPCPPAVCPALFLFHPRFPLTAHKLERIKQGFKIEREMEDVVDLYEELVDPVTDEIPKWVMLKQFEIPP